MAGERVLSVYTPLGKGKIVYHLPDGTFLVEFPHGGGRVFRPGELLRAVGRDFHVSESAEGPDGPVRGGGLP